MFLNVQKCNALQHACSAWGCDCAWHQYSLYWLNQTDKILLSVGSGWDGGWDFPRYGKCQNIYTDKITQKDLHRISLGFSMWNKLKLRKFTQHLWILHKNCLWCLRHFACVSEIKKQYYIFFQSERSLHRFPEDECGLCLCGPHKGRWGSWMLPPHRGPGRRRWYSGCQ